MKKQTVNLTHTARTKLLAVVKAGECKTRTFNRAHTLLMSSQGMIDEAIANALNISVRTVERTRDRYVHDGLAAALNEKPRPGGQKKLDAHQEAKLVAIACSKPPTGHKRWTLDLLVAELIEQEVVETINRSTVYSALKKTR